MSEQVIITTLVLVVAVLLVFIAITLHAKRVTERALRQMGDGLCRILNEGTDEMAMAFTDNKTLIELLTQINRLLEDRQKIKRDYRKSELSSKRMLSNISHDIKTPLTVILGYLEIMRLKSEGDVDALRKVENKANQVLELINKFFSLAKLEAGDADVPISHINLNEACKRNIVDFHDILTHQDFTVELNIPDRNIYALGNDESLDRILFNLISNALRYGSDGKYLGMTLREDDGHAYIDVIDKGKGVEKGFETHIFDRLYTLEDSRNKEIQGNGLGLTIAKRLAEILGGDVVLKSRPFIETVFTVKLKKATYSFLLDERNS